MSKPALRRVEEIFHEAVILPHGERTAYLNRICDGDIELRQAVEELIRHDDNSNLTDNFLSSPVTLAAQQHRLPPAGSTAWPTIPGYEILGDLGRGGMGVVFKARHISLNRIVAMKMLITGPWADAEQVARFRSEAELLARIHQPNIIPIYDIGECDGKPYFTMEYIDGPNLAKFTSGRPQDPYMAARLIEVLARAIQAVHDRGIIHRDLKPANILLQKSEVGSPESEQGRTSSDFGLLNSDLWPKITDFGLAKDWTANRNLTQTGMTMGTPNYMAPEQARCRPEEIGPAVDIYTLGAILYELLTGRPPFDAATTAETIARLLTEDPLPPDRLRAGLPRDLVTICLKCLEKPPRKRYSSALALAEDLHRFHVGETIRARPTGVIEKSARWCYRHPLAASLAGLCALLTVAFVVTVMVFNRKLALANEQQRQQIVHLNINIGADALKSGDALANVLRLVEALRLDPENENQYRERIAAAIGECPRIQHLSQTDQPVLCARTQSSRLTIAKFNSDRTIELRDVISGKQIAPPLKLADAPRSASLSYDGRWLAALQNNGAVIVWDVQEYTATESALPSASAVHEMDYQADSPHLLTKHADNVARLWDFSQGRPKDHTTAVARNKSTLVSIDGHWLITTDPAGNTQMASVNKIDAATKMALRPNTKQFAVSPDGTRVASIGRDQTVHVSKIGSTFGTMFKLWSSDDVAHAQFSPAGDLLALADHAGTLRIWDTTNGTARTPLLHHDGPLAHLGMLTAGNDVTGVAVVTHNGGVRIWDMKSSLSQSDWPVRVKSMPIDELIVLVEVVTNRRINEQQRCVPLDSEYLKSITPKVKSMGLGI